MCGITGVWQRRSAAASTPGCADLATTVTDMAATLARRGPDDAAIWVDVQAQLALGFRRLAIVDLSPAGRQPMVSASGRYVIVFNGEIYNTDELRSKLTIAWRGHSDTEVLLETIAARGIEAALTSANGMFGIALWDRQERTLVLARDRLGKKPLYWTDQHGTLMFGSQLRALMAHPAFERRIDRNAVAAYLRHNAVPNPHTVFEGVRQVTPGTLVRITPSSVTVETWWSLAATIAAAKPFSGSLEEATEALENLLGDAVARRAVADVPLGAFLSGGIDSATVVALLQQRSARPVKTFTIGYHEAAFDESRHAAAIARHLGTDHTTLTVSPDDALALVPDLPDIYDEPFADASQVPTLLVSRLARQQVTVAVSGDGGDEVFAGYNRYLQVERFARLSALAPRTIRRWVGRGIEALPPSIWDQLAAVVPARARPAAAGDKLHKLACLLGAEPEDFYRLLTSGWAEPTALIPDAIEPVTAASDPSLVAIAPGLVERMQARDTLTYLPDDILTKVDRATMAMSLEARNPLLDYRVVAFAWTLPRAYKLMGTTGKRVLRCVLARHVPPALFERPKMGFGIPIDRWLRGPLKDWAEDLLSERALLDGCVFTPAPIRQRWAEHQSGRRNWQTSLWTVLMFQAWQRAWRVI